MRKLAVVSICILTLSLAFRLATAGDAPLKRDIFGLHLQMSKGEVHKRLQELGRFVRDEPKQQEIWEVRDKSFSHLIVGFASNDTLRYVTAVAREDKEAKRVRYSGIGNLKAARQAGDPAINNFNYEWSLPTEKGDPEMLVIARGRDPDFLSTYSLRRVNGQDAGERDE